MLFQILNLNQSVSIDISDNNINDDSTIAPTNLQIQMQNQK